MNIFILGGTGFVGEGVINELKKDHNLLILTRELKQTKESNISYIKGDISGLSSLKDQIKLFKPDAFIYLIGLIREFPSKGVLFEDAHVNWLKLASDLATEIGIPNFILISANGVERAETSYEKTKLKGEDIIKSSNLKYVILRPSIIYAESEKYSFSKVLSQITSLLFVPYFIDSGKLAPIKREDLAKGINSIINQNLFNKKTYSVCGPIEYTFNELIKAYAKAHNKFILPIPFYLSILEILVKPFKYLEFMPLTDDQVKMLKANNTSSNNSFWEDTKIRPEAIFKS